MASSVKKRAVNRSAKVSSDAEILPPFHSSGGKRSHFYVIAYVIGRYVPTAKTDSGSQAFYVLNFSPSKGFTRFSYATVSSAGYRFRYTRGNDELDSVEFALLHAALCEGIPLHAWRLFPSTSIEQAAFKRNQPAMQAYEEARNKAAHIFSNARILIWIEKKYPRKPLFEFSESDFPQPMVDTPEYADISKYLMKPPHGRGNSHKR